MPIRFPLVKPNPDATDPKKFDTVFDTMVDTCMNHRQKMAWEAYYSKDDRFHPPSRSKYLQRPSSMIPNRCSDDVTTCTHRRADRATKRESGRAPSSAKKKRSVRKTE